MGPRAPEAVAVGTGLLGPFFPVGPLFPNTGAVGLAAPEVPMLFLAFALISSFPYFGCGSEFLAKAGRSGAGHGSTGT